jgi:hypothetical protein
MAEYYQIMRLQICFKKVEAQIVEALSFICGHTKMETQRQKTN